VVVYTAFVARSASEAETGKDSWVRGPCRSFCRNLLQPGVKNVKATAEKRMEIDIFGFMIFTLKY
jgi:hypothetical protein